MPKRHAMVLLAALATLLAAGCTSAGEQDATRDESGDITENEDVGVFRLQLGDCLVLPTIQTEGEEIETLEAIPCTEPHDGEVLALVTVPGDDDAPFPGDAAVEAQAQTDCVTEFETVTGKDFLSDPDWDITSLQPSADSWNLGDDREIVCIATPLDGGMTSDLVAG